MLVESDCSKSLIEKGEASSSFAINCNAFGEYAILASRAFTATPFGSITIVIEIWLPTDEVAGESMENTACFAAVAERSLVDVPVGHGKSDGTILKSMLDSGLHGRVMFTEYMRIPRTMTALIRIYVAVANFIL